jgi:RNA polymerase sigma factor (sigma-70 family)
LVREHRAEATPRQHFPYSLVHPDQLETLLNTITGCWQNEPRAQKLLYERYYGFSLKVVFRYIYRYDTATDVVNDGFIKIFLNLHKFQCPEGECLERVFMGWLRRIMIHTAIDHLRKQSFLPEIGHIPETVWMQADKGPAPDTQLLYKELVKEIRKLPPGYRAVFNMYMIDGLTHQEIADALQITVGTSKSNLFKAKAIMQKIIAANSHPRACAI